jgi:hypothetical protein
VMTSQRGWRRRGALSKRLLKVIGQVRGASRTQDGRIGAFRASLRVCSSNRYKLQALSTSPQALSERWTVFKGWLVVWDGPSGVAPFTSIGAEGRRFSPNRIGCHIGRGGPTVEIAQLWLALAPRFGTGLVCFGLA